MTNWKEALKIQAIAQEFADVNEDMETDLSGVEVTAVRDSHDGSIDLEVFIFGKGKEENEPPVLHVQIPMSCGLFDDDETSEGSVDEDKILKLFDAEFIKLVNQKSLRIEWNPGLPTNAIITPSASSSSRLFQQDQ